MYIENRKTKINIDYIRFLPIINFYLFSFPESHSYSLHLLLSTNNTTQQNTTKHNTTQNKTKQHNTTQHNTIRRKKEAILK